MVSQVIGPGGEHATFALLMDIALNQILMPYLYIHRSVLLSTLTRETSFQEIAVNTAIHHWWTCREKEAVGCLAINGTSVPHSLLSRLRDHFVRARGGR